MATFVTTVSPTPFGIFDSDTDFQTEADSMVVYVKRKLGDDVLSVELTKKEIWACFEEASMEYSRLLLETKIVSELTNVLGIATGSVDLTNKYAQRSLEYMLRMAEPYATNAYVGGSENAIFGYFDLVSGQQDYDIYTDLKDVVSGSNVYNSLTQKGKLRVVELFHCEPLAAQHFLLNASNITNFLATNFNYESYVNSSIFYVLPIFEDVLRRGMLESAFRVRRSHYSYEIMGSKLRIYPIPVTDLQVGKLYCKVLPPQNPYSPTGVGSTDQTIYGVSGPHNMPLSNLPFNTINQPGRQWIRQYTLALAKELLGLIRSKFQSIPIPNADLQLNGDALISQGREDKERLQTQMKEFLGQLTHQKLLEADAAAAESLNKQLRYVPMPRGTAITIG